MRNDVARLYIFYKNMRKLKTMVRMFCLSIKSSWKRNCWVWKHLMINYSSNGENQMSEKRFTFYEYDTGLKTIEDGEKEESYTIEEVVGLLNEQQSTIEAKNEYQRTLEAKIRRLKDRIKVLEKNE